MPFKLTDVISAMGLLEKYLNGETLRLYDEIAILGDKAFSDEHLIDVENVMTETFNRVVFNLGIICSELKAMGYASGKIMVVMMNHSVDHHLTLVKC